jgi:hypothetical protein
MPEESPIVEVLLYGGNIRVTFADGVVGVLTPAMVRRLALAAESLKRIPLEESSD